MIINTDKHTYIQIYECCMQTHMHAHSHIDVFDAEISPPSSVHEKADDLTHEENDEENEHDTCNHPGNNGHHS